MDIIEDAEKVAWSADTAKTYIQLLRLAAEVHNSESPSDGNLLLRMMRLTANHSKLRGYKRLAFAFDMGRAFEKSAIWPKIAPEEK